MFKNKELKIDYENELSVNARPHLPLERPEVTHL